MDPAAIDRFSGPPLAERAWVSEQARTCIVRPGADDLATLVARHFRDQGDSAIAWDAWRRTDGRWTVVAAVGGEAAASTWVYDPRSRSVHPDDAVSHRMASEDVVVPLRPSTSTTALARAEAPSHEPSAHDDSAHDDVPAADEFADEPDAAPLDSNAGAPAVEAPASPSRAKSRKGRRASVPRWDEILFGASESDA